jgi:hypothetical protein
MERDGHGERDDDWRVSTGRCMARAHAATAAACEEGCVDHVHMAACGRVANVNKGAWLMYTWRHAGSGCAHAGM